MILYVNIANAFASKILLKLGVIKASANHAADKFPVTADNALRKAIRALVIKIF